nr:hypothetical protein [Tanacetum cinerariifolium]
EAAHFLAALERVAAQDGRRARVRGLGEARVRLAAGGCLLGGAVGGGIRGEAVCAQLAVEVDLDGADVCGADGGVGEEAPAPAAEQDDALVEGEQAR